MPANISSSNLNTPAHQGHILSFLLIYRWISLAPTLWLFLSATGPVTPRVASVALLIITTGFTLLITIFHYKRYPVLKDPHFLGVDLIFIAVLLTLSDAGHSLYTFYALSPLLAGAFFFHRQGLLLASSLFTLFYLLILWLVMPHIYTSPDELSALFTQLAGLWLIPLLFEYPLALLNQLHNAHQSLMIAHDTLNDENAELVADLHQLELMHELSLALQGAPDRPSVQQRLLRAVVGDLGFSQAIIGAAHPTLKRLEAWQAHPPLVDASPPPLWLSPENGLLAQAALDQQICWSSKEEMLTKDETLNLWLGHQEKWLVIPMVWQTQTIGILLVAVDILGPGDIKDDRWAILTSLVSQAAITLGTIDHTQRLATETERNRIARDIHDTVAQSLFGIAFTLDACIKLLPQQVHAVQQELVELRSIADRVRKDVRQSILDIWPSDLTRDRFKADLCKYLTHTAPDHVFNVEFTIEGDFDGLPAFVRRSLYRVSQEALGNAARHAGVDSARLYLYVEPDEVFLSIRDKGHGFDPKQALARERNREHFGLRGMQERINALNGTCDILSEINHGTQVLVRVPIIQRIGDVKT